MASNTYFSATNNLRFYESAKTPDFATYFPSFDNQVIGVQYYEDRKPLKYIREHLKSKVISFQYQDDGVSDDLEVYKDGVLLATIASTNISPTGWLGIPVYAVAYTPSSAGVYYFKLKTTNYISDPILVLDAFDKSIIKIEYTNTINDYGTVFVNASLANVYTPICYFGGYINRGKMAINKEVFQADRGNTTTIRSTPMGGMNLLLEAVHETYLEYLEHIFACNTLKINDIIVNTEGDITNDQIEGTDCFDVKVNLKLKNTGYLKQ
jgi:hypothetical protein